MASITIGSSSGTQPYATLAVNVTSQDITNNTSTVAFSLSLHRPYAISSSATKYWSVTIDGQTYSGSGSIGGSGSIVLLSGSKVVNHNGDGTKSISFMASIGLNITWSGSWLGTILGNGSMTLTTIPRSSSFGTITGNTIGSSMTININRNSSNFTHQILYRIGESPWYDLGTGITTSKTFTLDMSLCGYITDSTTGKLSLCLRTYNGNNQIGGDFYTTVSVNIPPTVVPMITSVNVVEATANLANKFGVFVKSQSTLKITTTANGAYGSTIKSYSHSVKNATYTGNPATTGVISTSGTVAIKTTVTDSRGRTATKTTNVTIVDWFAPSITAFSVNRANSDGTLSEEGTRAKFTYTYSIAPISNKNDKNIKIQYLNGSTWTTLTTLTAYSASEQTYLSTIDFTVDSSFTFRLIANDYFVTDSKGIEKIMGPSFSLINFNTSGRSLSFGKPSARGENEKVIDFAIEIFDRHGTQIRNGFAYYPSGGADANETLEEIALCSKNIPYSSGVAYIRQMFYGGKTLESPRTQIAYPYNSKKSCYYRYYLTTGWTSWEAIDYYQYTASEQFTGKYWVDGKKIYQKTITTKTSGVAHGISDLREVTSLHATYYRNSTYGWADGSNDVTIQASTIYLTGDIASYVSGHGAKIVIEYTKNTD